MRWQLLLGNVFFALIWLPMRFFVGREWLSAGWHKVVDPAWTGDGTALQAYWQRAVAIPEQGRPPITYDWFRSSCSTCSTMVGTPGSPSWWPGAKF